MASVAVGLRLEREEWERLSAAAQALGLPLSVYLRRRLQEQDRTAAALDGVEAVLEREASARRVDADSAHGVLLEVLLILRQLAAPQKALIAQKELERRGIPTWK